MDSVDDAKTVKSRIALAPAQLSRCCGDRRHLCGDLFTARSLELFDHVYAFVKQYDAYDLDELIVVIFAFGFLMLVYNLRRAQDLKLALAIEEYASVIGRKALAVANAG